MGQFHHRNVVVMHGVVLTGKPVRNASSFFQLSYIVYVLLQLMVVLEMLPKGDLKQYLQSIA